jgi:hypothetical protein
MVRQSVYSEYPHRVDEHVDDVEIVPTTDDDRQRQLHVAGASVVEQTVEVSSQTFTGSSKEWRQRADAAQLTPDDIRRRAELYARMSNSRTPADDIVERFTVWYKSGSNLNAAKRLLGVSRDTVLHAVKIVLDEHLDDGTIPGLLRPERPTTRNQAELLVLINQYVAELRGAGLDQQTIKDIIKSIEPDEDVHSRVLARLSSRNNTATVSDLESVESILRKVYDYLFKVAGSALVKNEHNNTDTNKIY